MTNFNPNIKRFEPPHVPSALADGVLAALSRRMNPRLAWGPIRTLVLGIFSGGIIPLVLMQKHFRDFVIAERTHLWHFAEWLRLEFPGPETDRLQQAISKLRFRISRWIGAIALTALAIVWAWSDISRLTSEPISPALLFDFTARLPRFMQHFAAVPRVLLAAQGFTLLLIAAHTLSLWQVVSHARDVRNVCELFNEVAKKQNLPTVVAPTLRPAFTGIWLIATVASALLGAFWGVPMILAGAAQAGYINGSGRGFRLDLSRRGFNILASRAPVLDVAMPAALRGKCVRSDCGATIPAGANFCPRCGTRVSV